MDLSNAAGAARFADIRGQHLLRQTSVCGISTISPLLRHWLRLRKLLAKIDEIDNFNPHSRDLDFVDDIS